MSNRELVFSKNGAVELRARSGSGWRTDWSSDDDESIAEELGVDTFNAVDDENDVLDYLLGADIIHDGENIDIIDDTLDDDGDNDDE